MKISNLLPGVLLSAALALAAKLFGSFVPYGVISDSVIAMLVGMIINPFLYKYTALKSGIQFTSKKLLQLAIVLMGFTLSFAQIIEVGSYSLLVMCFTLAAAFGGGYILGKIFGLDWKLSGMMSAGAGICGGSAIAAIAPVIQAKDRDIAYAISAVFIFDVIMIILFPLAGRYFGMTDMGYGLWTGTAVNDTSAVVAAGYAFSDAAGAYAVIVKLTRTLSIIPVVFIFSLINSRINSTAQRKPVKISAIFPYFIVFFLVMVAIKSTGILPESFGGTVGTASKFLMVMALGAIGLKTNFKEVSQAGIRPLAHGFIVSIIVVLVSFTVQIVLGKL